MANIEASIRLKDDMSPALNKIVKSVNTVLSKLNAVVTSGGKVTQSFQKTSDAVSKLESKIALSEQQLLKINDYSNKIEAVEHRRLGVAEKLTNLGNLDTTQKQKLNGLLNERNRLTGLIGQHESANANRSNQIIELTKRIESLKRAEVVDHQTINKLTQQQRSLETENARIDGIINKHKQAIIQKDLRIKAIGEADVNTAKAREALLIKYNGLSNQKLTLEQKILGVLQQARDAEVKKAQAAEQSAQREMTLVNKIKSTIAQKAAKQEDYMKAAAKATAEVEKSFIAERKLAAEARNLTETERTKLNLDRQLKSEKIQLAGLTKNLISIEAQINSLKRQGLHNDEAMHTAQVRRASVLNQIKGKQQQIIGIENKIKTTQQGIVNTERQIKKETDNTAKAQAQHNTYVRGAVADANRLLTTLRNVVSVYALYNGAKNTLGLADTVAMTKARLGLVNEINGGLETTAQVEQKVYEAAMRSRGNYHEMAGVISKMGIRAGQVFGNMDEIIGFTETLNKMAAVSGTSVNELNSALLQVNQAMGAGRFQGDEFRSVAENLPLAMQAVAKYMGVSVGDLKELSKEGKITANTFKNAIFAAAADTEERFKKMPVTWGQVWNVAKNYMLKASQHILERISEITSSERFVGFMQSVSGVFKKLMGVVSDIFGKMSKGIAYVYDHWVELKPAIIGVVAALLLYKTVIAISLGISSAYAAVQAVMAARQMRLAGATFAATAQQTGLNVAMLACPWFWLVAGLVILGGVILSVMAATYDWESANIDVWGTIKNFAKAAIDSIKNAWQSLCEFLQPTIQAIGDTFNAVSGWIVENWDTIITVVSVVVGVFMGFGRVVWAVCTWAWGAINMVWEVLCTVWDIISKVVQIIVDNWAIISKVLSVIGLAILSIVNVLLSLLVITALVALGWGAWNVVLGIWIGLKTIALGIMKLFKAATWAQIWANIQLGVSQAIANAPLWVTILIIGLLLVAIAWLISKILEWCGVSVSTAGVICAAFAWLAATIYNIIAGVWNGILQLFDSVMNIVIDIIEWFLNAFGGGFDSFGQAVANLLGKIISWFLSLGQVVTKIIDAIFGTNWTAGLEALKSNVLKWGESKTKVTLKRDYASRNLSLNRVNATDWAKAGAEFGDNAGERLSKLTSGLKDVGGDLMGKVGGGIGDFGSGLGDLVKTGGNSSVPGVDDDVAKALTGGYDGGNPALDKIAGDTGKIADNTGSLDTNSEDTKYLRELAEREAINRYTLTDLNVNMTNNNNIASGYDADDLGRRLWRSLYNGARGVVPVKY